MEYVPCVNYHVFGGINLLFMNTLASKIITPGFNCILALADRIIALHSFELPRYCHDALR